MPNPAVYDRKVQKGWQTRGPRSKGQPLRAMFYMRFGGGAALGWSAVIQVDALTSYLECVVHTVENTKPVPNGSI